MEGLGLPLIQAKIKLLLPFRVGRSVKDLALVSLATHLELAVRMAVCEQWDSGRVGGGVVGVSVDGVVGVSAIPTYVGMCVHTHVCMYIRMYSSSPLTTDVHSWKANSSKKSDCQYATPLSQLGDHHRPFLQQQQQTI